MHNRFEKLVHSFWIFKTSCPKFLQYSSEILRTTAHYASNWHHQTIEHLTLVLKARYPFHLCDRRIQRPKQRPIVEIAGSEHGVRGITEHREHTHIRILHNPVHRLLGWMETWNVTTVFAGIYLPSGPSTAICSSPFKRNMKLTTCFRFTFRLFRFAVMFIV